MMKHKSVMPFHLTVQLRKSGMGYCVINMILVVSLEIISHFLLGGDGEGLKY